MHTARYGPRVRNRIVEAVGHAAKTLLSLMRCQQIQATGIRGNILVMQLAGKAEVAALIYGATCLLTIALAILDAMKCTAMMHWHTLVSNA